MPNPATQISIFLPAFLCGGLNANTKAIITAPNAGAERK
jgi:hypothetical protein